MTEVHSLSSCLCAPNSSVGPLLLVGCVAGVAIANYMTLGMHGAKAAAGGLSTEVKVMAFNEWINSFFFRDSFIQYTAEKLGKDASHYLLTYLRDLLSGTILYYLTAGLWHLYIYNYRGEDFFTVRCRAHLMIFLYQTIISLQLFIHADGIEEWACAPPPLSTSC